MLRINPHYEKLQSSYLFSEIASRLARGRTRQHEPGPRDHQARHWRRHGAPPPACIEAFRAAVDEMSQAADFRGYGPEQGYDFLRTAISENDYRARGAEISPDEIFISDGAKCDSGNIQELFATDATVAVPDPVYPVYVDTNVMAGRTGPFSGGRYEGLVYLECTRDNAYIPNIPDIPVDLIYLCFPNNPTGSTREAISENR